MAKVIDSKRNEFPSIYRKLRWSFGIMTLLMFSLFWSLIYVAENKLEILSLHRWLDTEVALYQDNFAELGWDAPLPNVREFNSYWSMAPTPSWLLSFQRPGFYEYLLGEEDKHFVVTPHPSGEGLMYVVFRDDSDDYLDDYETELYQQTLLLGGVLLVVIVGYGIYMVRSLSRPLAEIEQKIRLMSPEQPDFSATTEFRETRHIEQTLRDNKQEIAGYFTREQEFSRFSSHELRTPIMVIQGSVELLERACETQPMAMKAVNRIKAASDEMRVLTETFLLLGKKQVEPRYFGEHLLSDCLKLQLTQLQPLFAKQHMQYQLHEHAVATVSAPESFINIVFNNLIKNAFSYSIDDIQIQLTGSQVTVVNRHDGHATYNAGYGCGLAIVERICQRMAWQFEIKDDGEQFTAWVDFATEQGKAEKDTAVIS